MSVILVPRGAEAADSHAQPGLCNKTCLRKPEQRQLASMQIYSEIPGLKHTGPIWPDRKAISYVLQVQRQATPDWI